MRLLTIGLLEATYGPLIDKATFKILREAWDKYVATFGVVPHGTDKQLGAMLVLIGDGRALMLPIIEQAMLAEREACAAECDRHAKFCKTEADHGGDREHLMARYAEANWNAQKIRARSGQAGKET